jgi:glycosyltransferase involved in cell wall biosynthesis
MASLRVLHLFSNSKWTGPAEPAHSLAMGLAEAGVAVVFRSGGYTKGSPVNRIALRGTERGLAPVTDLALSKHRSLWRDARDVRRLRALLRRERFDLVHCHLPNDTRIAARALRRGDLPFVRTLYETEPERLAVGEIALLGRAARVFVFSHGMERELGERGVSPERIVRVEASVDLERFRPGAELPSARADLGFGSEHFVAGIVARVQPQRRFDLLLDAAEAVARACPAFRLVVIGRGSKLERTAREPARRRGLLDRVVFFPGYFEGDRYPAVLRALDVKIFLVPGTDGTARAVREALACGIPVVCTRRGMLPELVRDGVTGAAVEESAPALAEALLALARDPAARRRMGAEARRDAEKRFDPRLQVAAVLAAYGEVTGLARARSSVQRKRGLGSPR